MNKEDNSEINLRHIASVSGGKDSTALLILAKLERGVEIESVFADTGNEHPETYKYLEYLDKILGPIRTVKADFSQQIATRRGNLQHFWEKDGIPQSKIDHVKELLQPTGNPFLDLCMLKGRFPSTRARFCSSMLKHEPIRDFVVEPLQADGYTVVSWQGVRAQESASRANLDIVEQPEELLITYRPIITWSAEDVFDLHRKHGIQWNPLYEQGMSRVGCMPCIHARKDEILEISKRFPEEFERLKEWERIVTSVSKREELSTFFPISRGTGAGIEEVVEWSKTSRGGKIHDMFRVETETPMCSSIYGLCETAD